eukprot:TRINITY_DN48477_c0_g3_i1.p2 TRINITY_DN48477_c0_g3~~TRINITY_DN48477_c0_g3_i1.p2  ORF type:complete len:192 (-),score=99.43 TRINITY_DN48477_c0_g3_i1:63-584(-)
MGSVSLPRVKTGSASVPMEAISEKSEKKQQQRQQASSDYVRYSYADQEENDVEQQHQRQSSSKNTSSHDEDEDDEMRSERRNSIKQGTLRSDDPAGKASMRESSKADEEDLGRPLSRDEILSMFADAQSNILHLMSTDSFPRFRMSKHFVEFKEELKRQRHRDNVLKHMSLAN